MGYTHEIEIGNIRISGEVDLGRTDHNQEKHTLVECDSLSIEVEIDLGPNGEVEVSAILSEVQLENYRMLLIRDFAERHNLEKWVS